MGNERCDSIVVNVDLTNLLYRTRVKSDLDKIIKKAKQEVCNRMNWKASESHAEVIPSIKLKVSNSPKSDTSQIRLF